jgi:hypothetical protein
MCTHMMSVAVSGRSPSPQRALGGQRVDEGPGTAQALLFAEVPQVAKGGFAMAGRARMTSRVGPQLRHSSARCWAMSTRAP